MTKRVMIIIRGESFRTVWPDKVSKMQGPHNAKRGHYDTSSVAQIEVLNNLNTFVIQPYIQRGYIVDVLSITQNTKLFEDLNLTKEHVNGEFYLLKAKAGTQHSRCIEAIREAEKHITDEHVGLFVSRYDVLYEDINMVDLIDNTKLNFPFQHHYSPMTHVCDVFIFLPKQLISKFTETVSMWGHEMVRVWRKDDPHEITFIKPFKKASNPHYFGGENNELYTFSLRETYKE